MEIRELDPRTAPDADLRTIHRIEAACSPEQPFRSEELSLAFYRVWSDGERRWWLAGDVGAAAADDVTAVLQLRAGPRAPRGAPPGHRHGAARGRRRLCARTRHRVVLRAPLRRGGRRVRAARRRGRRPARRPLRGPAARGRPARAVPAGRLAPSDVDRRRPGGARRVVCARPRRDRRRADARRHGDDADRRRLGAADGGDRRGRAAA